MKNAMKKLMSLLLVAVLVVGMIPFGASAMSAGDHFDVFWTETNDGASYITCPILTDGSVDWSPVSAKVGSIDGFMARLQGWRIEGVDKTVVSLSAELTKEAIAMIPAGSYNIFPILAAPPAPEYITIYVNDQNSSSIRTHNVEVGKAFGESVLPTSPSVGKLGHTFNGWYLNGSGDSRVSASTAVDKNWAGMTIYGSWVAVPGACYYCGQPSGHTANCNRPQNGTTTTPTQPSTPTTPASTMYVDVIITPNKTSNFTDNDYYRCNLINGKITTNDRNAVVALVAGKNVGAWKRQDNGTQAYTLLDFDFSGLKAPVNILPVVNTTTTPGTNTNPGTTTPPSNNIIGGTYNKFPYNVYLNIYKDTMVGSPDKSIDITNGIALDGLVSLGEVKTVVANYYNAKNSYGIGFDGLYLARGNWVADYVADTHKYNEIAAGQMRQTGYVYINVMISNATAKGAATADRTNPKTGDSIYTAFTVMGLSAASLAAVMYFYNKKRYTV